MASSNTVAVVFKEVALALKPLATAPAAADPNQLPEVFTIALDGMGVALDRALGPDTVRTVVNAIGKITKAYQAIEPILARQTAPDLAEANVIAARLGDAFAGLAELSALKLKANLGEGLVELENVGRLLLD